MFNYSKTIISIVLFCLFCLAPRMCWADAGDLDVTFGTDGLVTTDIPGSNPDEARAVVAVQDDGKLVVAGSTQTFGGYDFALARYNPGGSLDDTFGTDGTVTTDFALRSDLAYAIAIQADGKIVVAGEAYGGATRQDFALARYDTYGNLDDTFGSGGLVTTHFGWSSDYAYAVAIQTDGKIVAAGYTYQGYPTYYDFAVARYNTDGSLDTTFGADGKVITHFGYRYEYAYAMAIQADDKIVLAGYTDNGYPTSRDFALARYNTDGSLDNDFGTAGLVSTDFALNWDTAYAVTIQADGAIVAAGVTYSLGYNFALARYHHSDGSLDTTFGTGGLLTTDFASSTDVAYAVAIQGDGQIVVAGRAYTGYFTRYDFALARYNSDDGSLDTTFGTSGTVTTEVSPSDDYAWDLAIDADGRIAVAGRTDSGVPSGNDFALVRYNSDGSPDSSFGEGGLITTDFLGSKHDFARDLIAVQADGKIVVAGQSSTGYPTYFDFALARYNHDGTLDVSFGTEGTVSTDFAGGNDYARAVAIQVDGKIVVAGYRYSGYSTGWDFALARYDTDGTLDTSFGTNGLVTTHFGSRFEYAYALAIQADGKIVAAGQRRGGYPTYWDSALARYNTDGSLDTTFGTNGLVTTHFGFSTDAARAIAIQTNGDIVVAGYTYRGYPTYTYWDFLLARYKPDGSLDGDFGSGGLVSTHFGSNTDAAYAIAIQADGKIVAAGNSIQSGTGRDFALARYNSDGTLDSGFGASGLVTTHFGYSDDYAWDLMLQANGKIIVVGESYSGSTRWDFGLARYNSDGSLDSDFGTAGLVTTDFGMLNFDRAYAVALQADGKIVAAGETWTGSPPAGTGNDFALARYEGVNSTEELIEWLIGEVQGLVGLGALNNGQGNSLLAKLQAAIQQLDGDNATAAINQLQAFINEVSALVAAEILLPAEAGPLIAVAQIEILLLLL
ncbi:MAG: hypothetical protein ACE5I3_06105 [Phycisphaerae bacterium]